MKHLLFAGGILSTTFSLGLAFILLAFAAGADLLCDKLKGGSPSR